MIKAYAIKDTRDGIIDFSTIAKKSKDSKLIFCNTDKWSYWYSIGYRCVPVLITEVKTDK